MRLYLLVSLLALVACEPASKVDAKAPRAPAVPRSLDWLPPGTGVVSYAAPELLPLIVWATQVVSHDEPACLDPVLDTLDATFQIGHGWENGLVHVAQGQIDRERFERCVEEILARMDDLVQKFGEPRKDARFDRQGPITEITLASGDRTYLGWSADGYVFWHDDRARVEECLSHRVGIAGNPELAAIFRRVDTDASTWMIAAVDATSRALGVVSRGVHFALRSGVAVASVSVVYETPELADAAGHAFTERSADATLPEALRSAMAQMHPTVVNDELVMDLVPLYRALASDPSLIDELRPPS